MRKNGVTLCHNHFEGFAELCIAFTARITAAELPTQHEMN